MTCTRLLGCLALLLCSAVPASARQDPHGPDAIAVNENTGGAGLAIPIEVPRGTAGFQPKLALQYSSQSGDGAFGIGWGVHLGEISRSTRFGTPAYDDGATPQTDRFELDGQLLARNGSDESRYHTAHEQFLKIVRTGETWDVYFPTGLVARYGVEEDTRIRREADLTPDSQDGPVFRWLLDELIDANGNEIHFTYRRDLDVGTAYPYRVEYTRRGGAPVGDLRVIEFVLEARPDPTTSYRGSVFAELNHRVAEIQVRVEGATAEPFSRRILTYDEGT